MCHSGFLSNHSRLGLSHLMMGHDGMANSYYGRCPKCASKQVQRSRRKNFVERAMGPIVLPWRCSICYTRFFRPFWFKAESRRSDIERHFQKTPKRAQAGLLGMSKEALPRFIQRNPALAFLIPTRRHVRHVQHAVSFGTK